MLIVRGEGRGKLGRAKWLRLELMAQFESQVPAPLGHDLPGFLSPGRMATPTVGIKLLVFVLQGRFKGAAMGGARATTSEAVKALWGRLVRKSS